MYKRTEENLKNHREAMKKCRGKNNHNYKNGLPKCIDCKKQLNRYASKRCVPCNSASPKKKSTRKKLSDATKRQWKFGNRPSRPKGKDNPHWSGKAVGYSGVHLWIRNNWKKTTYCEKCLKKAERIEWANLTGKYDRNNRKDWLCLCVSCHRKMDVGSRKMKRFTK